MAGAKNNVFHGCLIVLLFLSLSASGAHATRLHVATFGERTSGPSDPGDWSPANCYPSLAEASFQASLSDSILLYDETHQLDQLITLPSFLGNADMDANPQGARLFLSAISQMTIPTYLSGFTTRGLSFMGDGAESNYAAFLCAHGLNGGGAIKFEGCDFQYLTGSNELAGSGSCINGWGQGRGTKVIFDNCKFEDNSSRGIGGAMFFGNGYDIQISSCEFFNNASKPGPDDSVGSGGALAVASYSNASSVTCTNTFFSGNKSWGPGGTIYIADASLNMVDCELSDSSSSVNQYTYWSAGAGIMLRRTDGSHLEEITLQVEGCLFQRNIGEIVDNPDSGDGGAILVRGSSGRLVEVSVRHCDFLDNYNSQGAGLYIGRFANATVEYCHFLRNSSFMQGGAIYKGGVFEENQGETVIFRYCDFVGNRTGVYHDGTDSTSFGRGGAFSMRFFTRAEFHNCTFFNNSAHGPVHEGDAVMLPNEGYEFNSDLQRCDFINTVFYGTLGNSVQVVARPGAIGRFENCGYQNGEIQFGTIQPLASVILTDLPFTSSIDMSPSLDSPLIDAGQDNGQTMDLVGGFVPIGPSPDIGAYESPYTLSGVSATQNFVGQDLQGWPNPFSVSARIRVKSPVRNAKIEIFDLAGRKVRTVIADRATPDEFTAFWDGKDDKGRRQPTGTYLCRVRGNNSDLTMRLVLLK